MKQVILFSFLFLAFVNSYASNAEDLVAAIEKRTLIIVIETTIKSKYDKLDDDGKAAYLKGVENYNRKLTEVAEKFWLLNKNVEYKTWEEVNVLSKSAADHYVMLYAGNYSIQPSAITMIQKGLKFYPEIFADNDTRNYRDFYTSFKLCFLEDFKKDKYIIARTVANIWPLKEDIIFAFQYLQCILNETKRTNAGADASKVANTYNSELSKSKLYLKKDITDNGVNETSIKKVYAYEGMVVNRDTLLSAMMRKDNIAYVEIVPVWVGTGESMRVSYEHIIMNVKTGLVIGYLEPNYAVLHATMGHGTFHKFVSIGALEKYVSMNDNKPNFSGGEERE